MKLRKINFKFRRFCGNQDSIFLERAGGRDILLIYWKVEACFSLKDFVWKNWSLEIHWFQKSKQSSNQKDLPIGQVSLILQF